MPERSREIAHTRAGAMRAPVANLVDEQAIGFFPAEEAAFADAVSRWKGDLNVSYERPVHMCAIEECRAACCAWGAQVFESSAERIRVVVETYPEWFESHGLRLDVDAMFVDKSLTETATGDRVVFTATRSDIDRSSATRPLPEPERHNGCVMLLGDGRCSLQVFSEEMTGDPWYFKPIICWLFPALLVLSREGHSILTMNSSGADAENPEYPDSICPPCGRASRAGRAATEELAFELDRLGAVANRPTFRAEITEHTAAFPWVGPLEQPARVAGRNDPCPCGSGRKYKRCHGR